MLKLFVLNVEWKMHHASHLQSEKFFFKHFDASLMNFFKIFHFEKKKKNFKKKHTACYNGLTCITNLFNNVNRLRQT